MDGCGLYNRTFISLRGVLLIEDDNHDDRRLVILHDAINTCWKEKTLTTVYCHTFSYHMTSSIVFVHIALS